MITMDSIIEKVGYNPLFENVVDGLDDQPPLLAKANLTEEELQFIFDEAVKCPECWSTAESFNE